MKYCEKCNQPIDPEFIITVEGKDYHRPCLEILNSFGNSSSIKCQICGKLFQIITAGHLKVHSITMREYRYKYGTVVSEDYTKVLARSSRTKGLSNGAVVNDPEPMVQEVADIDTREGVFITRSLLEKLNSRFLRELVLKGFGVRVSKKGDCVDKLCSEVIPDE